MSTPGAEVLGLPAIDQALAPYLPKGWLALLIGHGDAETSLFAKQFADGATVAAPARYYTTYERSEDVRTTFERRGWDPSSVEIVNLSEEYFQHVLSRPLEVSRIREKGLELADLTGGRPSHAPPKAYNLTNRILAGIASLDGPFRLVLDSLDFLLEVLSIGDVMTIARQARHRAQLLGGQALAVVHGEIHERRTSGLLEDLADIVVEIGAEPAGDGFAHRLSIRKVRNHPELKRTALLTVTPHGFAVQGSSPS